MILKALYDYYYRSLQDKPDSLPKYGWMEAYISFVIVIKNDGTFVRLEDLRDEKRNGTMYVLPYGKHTNSITPFLFWDNCTYVLGYNSLSETENEENQKNINTVHEKHLSFVKQCECVYECTKDDDLKSVVCFYKNNQLALLKYDILWDEIKKNPNVYLTFRIEGETKIIASNPKLINFVRIDAAEKGVCLITGEKTDIVRKIRPAPIPLKGCKSSASLVTFQKDRGYDSYGKEQAYNAPISVKAEFAFSTAFLKLISKDSHNKFQLGNRLYVFWASSKHAADILVPDVFLQILGLDNDDPNARIEEIKELFLSIYSGKVYIQKEDMFYILGIAPNFGRETVVYYTELPLKKLAGTILKHFEDMEIVDACKDKKPYMGLHSILGSVTLSGKSSDAAPNLPDAVVKSIFEGLPYPASLFQACIRRIRAEQSVNIVRAAIIKAYLNRLNNTNDKKIEVMLDKENHNQGYLCGRLFAVLDKIQEDAKKIHTIRERYMNSASATPAMVFATILNLSLHHLEKLSAGGRIKYEKLKQEIISKLNADGFPAHLSLQDQGRFFVGYYHQWQDFFTSKADKDSDEQ